MRRGLAVPDALLERTELARAGLDRGEPRGLGLEHEAGFDDVASGGLAPAHERLHGARTVDRRGLMDERATRRHDLHQASLLEAAQDFAHGGSAEAEALRQLPFRRQRTADSHPARHDLLEQMVEQAVSARALTSGRTCHTGASLGNDLPVDLT